MSHQPYENWILEMRSLSDDQQRLLDQHMEGCKECRQLQERWTLVRVDLEQPVELAPRPGFTRRWKAGLAERRLREQRRQAWKFFLACSGAAAAAFAMLVTYIALSTTPVQWIQAGVKALSSSVGYVTTLRDISASWTHIVPPALNVAFWFSLVITFFFVTLIWVFALWRTSMGGTIQR